MKCPNCGAPMKLVYGYLWCCDYCDYQYANEHEENVLELLTRLQYERTKEELHQLQLEAMQTAQIGYLSRNFYSGNNGR